MTTANIQEEKKRVRKPKPRHYNAVLGSLAERIHVLREGPFPARPHTEGDLAEAVIFCELNAHRITELIDELSRSLNGKADDGDE